VQRSSELRHGVIACVAVVDAEDAVPVAVEGHRQSVLLDMAIERVHVAQGAFLRHKAQLGEAAGGIVNEHQETAARPARFEPGMGTTVDLNQFAKAWPPFAQGMQARFAAPVWPPQLGRDHDLAHRFLGQGKPVAFVQILRRQGRPEIAVMGPNQGAYFRHHGRRQPTIAGVAAAGRAQCRRASCCHLGFQASHLAYRHPQPPGRLGLFDLPGSAQGNDLDAFQFLLTHAGLHHASVHLEARTYRTSLLG